MDNDFVDNLMLFFKQSALTVQENLKEDMWKDSKSGATWQLFPSDVITSSSRVGGPGIPSGLRLEH